MSYSVLSNKKFQKSTIGKPKYKDTRGNWPFAFFQKGKDGEKQKEQLIKAQCPTGNFEHKKIDNLMNPVKSREEIILDKYFNGEKLNSKEKIICNNLLDKEEKDINNDLEQLKKFGLNATVSTDEGRMRKLFRVLNIYLKKDDKDMVYYVSQKINEFINDGKMSTDIEREFRTEIEEMNSIIDDIDTIELQFTKFHSNMPPLNQKGFIDLDPFQKDVIRNIDSKKSTIVQAPTSAGKSILTGYLYTKNINAIVVVPTDILAWQMASMIGKINDKDIPIITKTFQSFIETDELVENINRCGIVVGTPKYLLDILPMIDVKFDWIVVDEVHMIGKDDCCEMETIIKAYSDIPILALSATIGNVEELRDWFDTLGYNTDIVVCNKRFFNLQRFYYNNNNIHRINPLSMVCVEDFTNSTIKKMALNPTPPDVWELSIKLIKYNLPGELISYCYFKKNERISLDRVNEYFSKLIDFICTLEESDIDNIIKSFQVKELKDEQCNLVDVALTLKNNDKTPALIFHTNTYECLSLVKKFSIDIRERENKAHPNLLKERLKLQSRAKHLEKKKDSMKIDEMNEKKQHKMMMSGKLDIFDDIDSVSLNEPHIDFIFNKHQYFTQHYIEEIYKELKGFFHMDGNDYHYIIDLLWRGVGVYVKGLPDPYLRIVQNLACGGRLGIVFSDESLVFGVSMPFRTTVITKDDNIDSMMYHQMAGRAGRRGLDKEGNVLFVGCSWDNITDLSVSSIPNIVGCDTATYGGLFAEKLSTYYSKDNDRWINIRSKFLKKEITDEKALKFYTDIQYNLDNGWDYIKDIDNKHFYHMLWKLRHTKDTFRVPYLIQYLRKLYHNCNPTNQNTQIEVFKIFSKYLTLKNNLNTDIFLSAIEEVNIDDDLDKLCLSVPSDIDGRLYNIIRMNCLTKLNYNDINLLREQVMEMGEYIRHIQHYFYYMKEVSLTRLLGKLLTRIWWVYHLSSPLME
jgi:hypothetical protein